MGQFLRPRQVLRVFRQGPLVRPARLVGVRLKLALPQTAPAVRAAVQRAKKLQRIAMRQRLADLKARDQLMKQRIRLDAAPATRRQTTPPPGLAMYESALRVLYKNPTACRVSGARVGPFRAGRKVANMARSPGCARLCKGGKIDQPAYGLWSFIIKVCGQVALGGAG